jgi:hypothetical protein
MRAHHKIAIEKFSESYKNNDASGNGDDAVWRELILAHNEMLYPFHKWMIRRLKEAPKKPRKLIKLINNIITEISQENVEVFYSAVKEFLNYRPKIYWGILFNSDTELAWFHNKPNIANI